MRELIEFHQEVVDIYGYLVQVNAAIGRWRKFLVESATGPTTLRHTFYFGRGDPNRPRAKYQYKRSFGDLITAADNQGVTSVLHRRSVIVLLVATWEDRYRSRIASECGLAKNDITSDLFRDLNRYRQAILHAGGKLRDEPLVLSHFAKGDEVSLTSDHMDSIFRMVIDELNRLGTDFYGTDPGFAFDKSLNA